MSTGPDDVPARVAVAGAYLRQLRRQAGFSQQDLARMCGISDRTVRGLERGAIKNPQRDTLLRLAGALGLNDHRRADLLKAWRNEQSRPTLDKLLDAAPKHAPASAMAHLQRQMDSVRETMLWNRMAVTASRTLRSIQARRTFAVVAPGIERWVFVDSLDTAMSNGKFPQLINCSNCRPGRAWPFRDDAILFELLFDHELRPGSTHTFEFEITYESLAIEQRLPIEVESLSFIRALGPSLVEEVVFDPAALPASIWLVEQDSLHGQSVQRPSYVSPFGLAHGVFEHPAPGVYGLRWSWPD